MKANFSQRALHLPATPTLITFQFVFTFGHTVSVFIFQVYLTSSIQRVNKNSESLTLRDINSLLTWTQGCSKASLAVKRFEGSRTMSFVTKSCKNFSIKIKYLMMKNTSEIWALLRPSFGYVVGNSCFIQ